MLLIVRFALLIRNNSLDKKDDEYKRKKGKKRKKKILQALTRIRTGDLSHTRVYFRRRPG